MTLYSFVLNPYLSLGVMPETGSGYWPKAGHINTALQDQALSDEIGLSSANPQMQAVLDQLDMLGGSPIENLDAGQAREQPTFADAVKALLSKRGESAAPQPVGEVKNIDVAGAESEIPLRIYWPQGLAAAPYPVIVYYHGGGWVMADIDTYDSSARSLANAAGAIVIAARYRQAPEHKFPAAHEDAYTSYQWALAHAESLGGDSKRVAVAGEGAGGNMAAGVAIRARDEHIQLPIHQLLIYPVTNCTFDTISQQQNNHAKPLNTPMLSWFYEKYLSRPGDGANPVFSILRTEDLSGLPSATVITAELDPLRSEGEAYAECLQRAGIDVDYKNYEGVTHEFFGMGAVLDQAKLAVEQAAMSLRIAFNNGAFPGYGDLE